jgi:hypothetical protein
MFTPQIVHACPPAHVVCLPLCAPDGIVAAASKSRGLQRLLVHRHPTLGPVHAASIVSACPVLETLGVGGCPELAPFASEDGVAGQAAQGPCVAVLGSQLLHLAQVCTCLLFPQRCFHERGGGGLSQGGGIELVPLSVCVHCVTLGWDHPSAMTARLNEYSVWNASHVSPLVR